MGDLALAGFALPVAACGGLVVVDPGEARTSGTSSTISSTSVTTTSPVTGCGTDAECPSGHCADGVCCDTACDGVCSACTADKSGGTDGVCTFVPSGTDPDGECGMTTCDGSGACTTPCGGKTCVELGFACGECLVDSSGCGAGDKPWAGWNDAAAPAPDDAVVQLSATKGDVSGDGSNNGGANTDGPNIEVGQSGPDLGTVGALTFDLPADLASKTIVGATLHAFQWSTNGAAYSDPMTDVVLDHVRFPSVFGAFDASAITATFTSRTLSTTAAAEWKTADVTEAVRYELATCRTRAQLRLQFAPSNASPSWEVPNLARFRSDDALSDTPYLEVRYR